MLRSLFVLLRNVVAFLWYLWSAFWFKLGYLLRRKKKLYVCVDLKQEYAFGPPQGMAQYFQQGLTYLELRERLRKLKDLDDVDGVIINSDGVAMGTARSAALADEFDAARRAGKHVVAHGRMPSSSEYLIMTAADDILMTPSGRLYTFGPRFDQFFGAEALSKIGAHAQFVHIGDFKTASHRFIHHEMQPAQELMMRSLYDSLTDVYDQRVSERRPLQRGEGTRLFDEAPADVRRARQAGLIDHGVFRGRIDDWLRDGAETPPVGRRVELPPEEQDEDTDEAPPEDDEQDILYVDMEDADKAIPPSYDWKPLFSPRQKIAVMDLSGMIVAPDTSLPGRQTLAIDPEEVLPKLNAIRQQSSYAGLLLHINSPGGSALASDVIWEAIDAIRQQKPVVAYCSDVVASGGYYLAVAADEIICHRETIAGSIGVIVGKISAPDLPDKLGLNVESIYERDGDTFTSIFHPLSDDLLERLNRDTRAFYRRFLQRVGQARPISRKRLHRYARGRVYMGEDAHRRGLVDELGGIQMAYESVCRMARLEPDETEMSYVPHRTKNLKSILLSSSARAVSDELVGETEWMESLTRPAMVAQMLQNESTLALMPWQVTTSGRK